jgi:signal peptidase II
MTQKNNIINGSAKITQENGKSNIRNILPNFCSQYFLLTIFVALIITIADLSTKKSIFNYLATQEGLTKEFSSFFSLVLVVNKGISFGMFNDLENSMLIFTIIQFTIAVIIMIYASFHNSYGVNFSLGLIIGGAFGNAIDRAFNGGVADFLDFHWQQYHWPAFNLADTAICCGVFIFLIFDLKKKKSHN